jgi:FKBP-type peptidyl-prolyl cis-trans isomerase 2
MKRDQQVAGPTGGPRMKKGTIVHIDYDLYNADTESLLETTREDVAKEHEIHDERRTYKPMITVIGDGRLIKGFEEHLESAKEKEEYTFDIEPEDAYGDRDGNLVETVGMNVLMRSVRDPDTLAIGSQVEINGRSGVLQMARAGRARIDYNHPLAGVKLRYTYSIVKVVKQKKARVQTLLEMKTGKDDFEVKFEKDDVTITLPESIAYDQNWPYAKFSLVRTLREHLGVGVVVFREVHEPRKIDEEE